MATLRIFQRAVQCIAKLGKDAALIFQPSQLVLRGADDGHSAALHFVFGARLFRSVAVSGETKVVVVARQLLLPLSGATGPQARQNTEGLTLRLAGQRILLEFSSRGVKVRHGVPLLETLPFLPADPAAGPHAAAMAPSLLAKVMQHCIPNRSGCEEVTLGAAVAEGLRVQSEDLTGAEALPGSHRTEVLVQMSDLEACHLDPSGGEVRLLGRGLRDFAKAAEVFARDLDSLGVLDGSALLELRFGAASGSVLCSLAMAAEGVAREMQSFRAVFSVAIRESSGSLPPAPTPAPSAPASAASRRPQPRQGAKRRAVEATLEDFDAFPEHSQRPVIDLTQLSSAPAAPAPVPAVPRASQGELPLFTAQQKAQMATQLSTQLPSVPPSMPPPTVPATPLPSQNGSQEVGTGSWWQGRATPPAQVMASLSRPAVSASPVQPGVRNVGNAVLASHLENTRDVLDSDDELIGADPDEIAFARGDQEEEAPDWFDCEKLW